MKKLIQVILATFFLFCFSTSTVFAQSAKEEKAEKKIELKDSKKVQQARKALRRSQRAESRVRQQATLKQAKLTRQEEKSLKKARQDKARNE